MFDDLKLIQCYKSGTSTVIVVNQESRILFWRATKERRFAEYHKVTNTLSEWVELPENRLCGDSLNFQLTTWKNLSNP